MNDQCDVNRLDAALDDDADRLERAWAARHLGVCDRCRTYATRRRAIEMQLSSLPATLTPARPLWDGIAARIGLADTATRRLDIGSFAPKNRRGAGYLARARTMWRVAASLTLLAGGYAAGISRGTPVAIAPARVPRETAIDATQLADAAEEVQRIGSAWTASLARLGAVPPASPSVERRRREVALATMQGAVAELARIAPGQPGVVAAYGAIREEHQKVRPRSGTSRLVAF